MEWDDKIHWLRADAPEKGVTVGFLTLGHQLGKVAPSDYSGKFWEVVGFQKTSGTVLDFALCCHAKGDY